MRALLINVVNCLKKTVKIHHFYEKIQQAPNLGVLSPHWMLKARWAIFLNFWDLCCFKFFT